ncbi:hypothetical protein Glove_735g12 [Diversispora epigaea]|uniref:Uncharacterized protein n=1 Tax=Diversispora epigaea TaxID=1348612 RepID=A0A397G4W4_9GLOM|nr:hypothetical protein Glove_735g12 [Diversispora epigaea]
MPRCLRFDATPLSSEAICEIINARGTKNALSILTKKYKITNTRIYKIWRRQEYPIDPFLLKGNQIQSIDWDKEIENTPYLKSYYRRGSTFLSFEQIETIRILKGKVPKYRIIRDFCIHENQIDDIWENCERQQQIIQSTISSEILPMPTILPENSNRIESEVLLQSRPLSDELEIRGSAPSLNHTSSNLHLESSTSPNTEIKKRSSKSRSKSVRISDPIPSSSSILVNNAIPTEKISVGSSSGDVPIDIKDQIEREIKRKDKILANARRISSTI